MAEKKAATATVKTENQQTVKLSQEELAAGLVFEREIRAAQAAMQQATIGRNAFTGYLKAAKGVPPDWEIRDWEIGFEPPQHQ